MGIHGISLAPVELKEVHVDPHQIIGEFKYEGSTIVESSSKHLLIDGSARLIGASRRMIEQCLYFI